MIICMFMTKKNNMFYLLMSEFNFLWLWVVIQQHTSLDIVEIYLEKKRKEAFFLSQNLDLTFTLLNDSDSEIRKRLLFTNLQRLPQKTILSSCQQGFKSWASQIDDNETVLLNKKDTYLVHINGRKHVLKHSGHEFDLHAIRSKVVEDEEWVVSELLLVHPVLLQRWDHIFDERVLGEKKRRGSHKNLAVWTPRCVYFETIAISHIYCICVSFHVYLEHSEMKHGTFGKPSKSLKAQEVLVDGWCYRL